MIDITKLLRAKVFDVDTSQNEADTMEVDVQVIVLPHLPYTPQAEIIYNGGRSGCFELLPQNLAF